MLPGIWKGGEGRRSGHSCVSRVWEAQTQGRVQGVLLASKEPFHAYYRPPNVTPTAVAAHLGSRARPSHRSGRVSTAR
jgi:hypothetical protein